MDYNVTNVPFAFETKSKHVNGFIRKLSVKTLFTSVLENKSEIVKFILIDVLIIHLKLCKHGIIYFWSHSVLKVILLPVMLFKEANDYWLTECTLLILLGT